MNLSPLRRALRAALESAQAREAALGGLGGAVSGGGYGAATGDDPGDILAGAGAGAAIGAAGLPLLLRAAGGGGFLRPLTEYRPREGLDAVSPRDLGQHLAQRINQDVAVGRMMGEATLGATNAAEDMARLRAGRDLETELAANLRRQREWEDRTPDFITNPDGTWTTQRISSIPFWIDEGAELANDMPEPPGTITFANSASGPQLRRAMGLGKKSSNDLPEQVETESGTLDEIFAGLPRDPKTWTGAQIRAAAERHPAFMDTVANRYGQSGASPSPSRLEMAFRQHVLGQGPRQMLDANPNLAGDEAIVRTQLARMRAKGLGVVRRPHGREASVAPKAIAEYNRRLDLAEAGKEVDLRSEAIARAIGSTPNSIQRIFSELRKPGGGAYKHIAPEFRQQVLDLDRRVAPFRRQGSRPRRAPDADSFANSASGPALRQAMGVKTGPPDGGDDAEALFAALDALPRDPRTWTGAQIAEAARHHSLVRSVHGGAPIPSKLEILFRRRVLGQTASQMLDANPNLAKSEGSIAAQISQMRHAVEIGAPASTKGAKIEAAIRLINKRLKDRQNIDLAQIARAVGISADSLKTMISRVRAGGYDDVLPEAVRTLQRENDRILAKTHGRGLGRPRKHHALDLILPWIVTGGALTGINAIAGREAQRRAILEALQERS